MVFHSMGLESAFLCAKDQDEGAQKTDQPQKSNGMWKRWKRKIVHQKMYQGKKPA